MYRVCSAPVLSLLAIVITSIFSGQSRAIRDNPVKPVAVHAAMARAQADSVATGREIFRFDTFGDEQLWTDTLRMHDVIESVTPKAALSLGLKVDSAVL